MGGVKVVGAVATAKAVVATAWVAAARVRVAVSMETVGGARE